MDNVRECLGPLDIIGASPNFPVAILNAVLKLPQIITLSLYAMHPALRIRDILHEICYHLTPPPSPSDWYFSKRSPQERGRGVLFNTALTCRTFSVPALKQLWLHVPTIEILLELLPSSAKLVSNDANVSEGEALLDSELGWSPRSVWVRGRWTGFFRAPS